MPGRHDRPRILRLGPRAISVTGDQRSGWRCVVGSPSAGNARTVPFGFELQDDDHGCLLCYTSTDGRLYGDTWHVDLYGAMDAAHRQFGIEPDEWEAGA